MRITTRERAIAGALVVVAALGAVGWFVLRSAIDHVGDRADRALAKATQVDLRVSGLDVQVHAALAEAQGLADRIQAGLAVDISGLRAAVDSLVGAVQAAPALAAQAGDALFTRFSAAMDTVKGLLADVERLTGVPVTVGGSVAVHADVDVHILRDLVTDIPDVLNAVLGLLPQITARLG